MSVVVFHDGVPTAIRAYNVREFVEQWSQRLDRRQQQGDLTQEFSQRNLSQMLRIVLQRGQFGGDDSRRLQIPIKDTEIFLIELASLLVEVSDDYSHVREVFTIQRDTDSDADTSSGSEPDEVAPPAAQPAPARPPRPTRTSPEATPADTAPAPPAEPDAAPASAETPDPEEHDSGQQVSGGRQVVFTNSQQPYQNPPEHQMRVLVNGSDVHASWDEPSDEDTSWIYRLFWSTDFIFIPGPNGEGEEVGVTCEPTWDGTVRHETYQNVLAVWRYPDTGETQIPGVPVLHALHYYSSPVTGVQADASSGQINLFWDPLEAVPDIEDPRHHDTTLIYRFDKPREARVAMNRGGATLAQTHASKLIAEAAGNAFEDQHVGAGIRYTYLFVHRTYLEAGLNGSPERYDYSEATAVDAELQVRPERSELTTQEYQRENAHGSRWDVVRAEYTKVPGDTSLYLTATRPAAEATNAGANRQLVSAPELEAYGLPADAKLSLSTEDTGDTLVMENIGFPEDHTEFFLTPVTHVNNGYLVGVPQPARRVRPLEQLRVQQRLTWQLVTFKWPEGASHVQIFRVNAGTELTEHTQPLRTITHEQYVRESGVRLQNLDTTKPATIIARGHALKAPNDIYGEPGTATLQQVYPYSYTLVPIGQFPLHPQGQPQQRGGFRRRREAPPPAPMASWYEVRIRFDGKILPDEMMLRQLSFHLAIGDRNAPLAPLEMREDVYRRLNIYRHMPPHQGEPQVNFTLPQLEAHGESQPIGYLTTAGTHLSDYDLIRVRLMPNQFHPETGTWKLSFQRRDHRTWEHGR